MADAPPFAENRAKVIAAFFLAPVIPAILDGFWLIWTEGDLNHPDMRPLGWFLYGAYPTVFLFGIPCYAVFKDVIAPSALNCVLFGAAIAGIPWALLSFFAGDWHGVLYFAKFSVLPGALGGLIFWAIATSGQKAPWR